MENGGIRFFTLCPQYQDYGSACFSLKFILSVEKTTYILKL